MPGFNAPTARFPSGLRVTALDPGDVIVRVHREAHGAIFFGPAAGVAPQGRFDAPSGQFRLLYAAQRLEGAFVETVLRRPANRIVRRAFVEQRMWTPLRLQRQIVLAKLMDEGLLFHGVDAPSALAQTTRRREHWRSRCTRIIGILMDWPIDPGTIMGRFATPSSTVCCRAIF